jgi:hypothetical protein
VVAAEPYTFYIALDVNQCNSAPFTDSYPMTIASGQSSVSYMIIQAEHLTVVKKLYGRN